MIVKYYYLKDDCKFCGPYECGREDFINFMKYLPKDVWLICTEVNQNKYQWTKNKKWGKKK